MSSATQRALVQMNKQLYVKLDIAYITTAIVLWDMGWRKERIMRMFEVSQDVWNECARSGDEDYSQKKSMLEMLEDATGIELRLSSLGNKSWHELPYFDHTNRRITSVTEMQDLYIKQNQIKWLEAQILACIMLSLHRREGWGFERISRLNQQYDSIRCNLGGKPSEYYRLLTDATGMTKKDLQGLHVRNGFANRRQNGRD